MPALPAVLAGRHQISPTMTATPHAVKSRASVRERHLTRAFRSKTTAQPFKRSQLLNRSNICRGKLIHELILFWPLELVFRRLILRILHLILKLTSESINLIFHVLHNLDMLSWRRKGHANALLQLHLKLASPFLGGM